jgi:Na+/phosphate symporter
VCEWHGLFNLICAFIWILFVGLLYWSVMNLSEEVVAKVEDSCHKLKSFSDAFLLSIDSQTTIGFGNYSVDSYCKP